MAFYKLTGLTFYEDSDYIVRDLTGLTLDFVENLTVRVVDQVGNLIPNSKISISKDGGVTVEYDLPTGEYFELIEDQTEVTVTVLETASHIAISAPVTFTISETLERIVQMEVRKTYWYKVRAVKDTLASPYTSPTRLTI